MPTPILEEGEGIPDGSMVAWHSEDVPCPLRCRTYPEEALGPNQWMAEEETSEQLPQLWE